MMHEQDELEDKVRDLERQLAQAARREIDIERQSQDTLAEAEELRNASLLREQRLAQQLAQKELDCQSLCQELAAAQEAATSLQGSDGAHTQALQQKQAEVQSVRETNRLLDGRLQQLQSQLQESAANNKQARESVMELTRERGDLDMKRMHAENELRQCQHARQSLELEKDILQRDVASLQTQLDDKSEGLRQSWKDANFKVHDLEQQLHNANNNNQAMTASNKQLEQQRQSLTEQLHTAQQACQEAQTQLRDQQAAFEEESASMHNLASRHKEERASLEKDKQNLDALKEELLKTVEALRASKAGQQQNVDQLQQRLAVAEQACQERDQTIARFKEAFEQENGEAALLSAMQSPEVTALRPSGQGPLSPVQSYAKYVSVVQERNKLRKDYATLQAEREEFERKVIPEAQKAVQTVKRNAILDEANARLSAQVQVSNEKAKRCERSALKWQDQLDIEKAAHSVTRKILMEAQHQVSLLVNETRQLSGVREQAVMPAWTANTLDANLVEFRSVKDLVSKNEALRRQLHELQLHTEQQLKRKDVAAQAEEERRSQIYQKAMDEAKQLNAELKTSTQQMMQQRDAAQQAARTAAENHSIGNQQGGSQQQPPQVEELKKELDRLKQDGQAYREDLMQQLEAAKHAATQARHDAAQASSQAAHEANQVQLLQSDRARMGEIADSWRKQANENQVLISGLNRRLEQLNNECSRSRDAAEQRAQRVAVLESQLDLLRNDNQRLSHESTEHASARWRLTAERDTQQRLSAQQHEEDAKERERLHSQLSAAQRELAESQRKLTEERSSNQHGLTSVKTVQDAADARLATIEESKAKLQEALTHAERQLAASEARVASLQSAVEKSEERAASLDLQVKAKSSPASGSGGPSAAGDNQQLSKTIAALRKDVAEAQQQAAQEAGHVAQYRSLAEGAEENTRIVQEQLDRLKVEAGKTGETLQEAKVKLDAAEKDLNASRQSAYEDSQAANKEKQEMHSTITHLQAELVIAKRHSTTDSERQQKMAADLDMRTKELKQAQSSYNKSVLDHAETVKQLSQQEALVTELQQQQAAREASGQAAHKAKADAELVWNQQRYKLEAAAQATQRRLQDLEKVNAELQVHLDSQARAAAGEAPEKDGQLAGLVQYLQKRLRTLEGENTSLEQVVSRLKIDAEAATRRASQAEQARLETAEQLRNSLRTKEQHEHQMQQVQEVNLLRESNVTLRNMSDRHRDEAESYRRQTQQLQAQLEPLKRQANELQAHVDSHQEEIKIHEDAMRHAQRRIADLLHKADAVDKTEYERVVTALKAAEGRLLSLEGDAARLQPLADQLEPLQAKVARLEAEVQTKVATIDKQKNNVAVAQRLSKAFNPQKMKIDDIVAQHDQRQRRLEELSKRHPELQQAYAALEASSAQQAKQLADAQLQIKQLGKEATAAGASNSNLQKQQEADVARAQSAEQVLHLQITALNLEMKQKNDQLAELRTAKAQMEAEMRTAKKQLEEQLAAAKAEAAAGKSLADRAMDDLKDSLAAQQATIKPAADSALAPVPTPQAGSGASMTAEQESQAKLLAEREAALQHAQSALQSQQQQLAEQQQLLEQQQQRVQQGEAASSRDATQLTAQVEQLQKKQEESAQAARQLQEQVTALEAQVKSKQTNVAKFKRTLAEIELKLHDKGFALQRAVCRIAGRVEVNKVMAARAQDMAQQLTDAGLPVPPEGNMDELYQSVVDKCLDEKNKASAVKAPKQATPAGSPKGVSAAGSIQSSKAGGSSSAAPAPPAGSTAEAEMQAVRNRALASANLATVKRHTVADPAARSSPAAPSPHAAGVKPVLRLRASAPHQGAKRERDVSPSMPVSPEAQPGAAAPPAKRVRAPTPVAEPTPVANQDQRALTSVAEPTSMADRAQQQAELPSTSQKPAEDKQTQANKLGANAPAPPTSETAGQVAAAGPQQEHVARVSVAQQDPERVQVKIETPSVVHLTRPPQQLEAAHPAQHVEVAQPAATPAKVPEAGDVDMTEGPAAATPDAAKPEPQGDDAEDGELPDADDGEAGEQEAPGTQLQATPAAGDGGAAETAGQGDASDADGNAGGTGRKPIIFNLTAAGAPEPSPPVSASQPRTGRAPSSEARRGRSRGGAAAGRTVHSAVRGRGRQARGGRH